MKALNNQFTNDSIHVQFSASVGADNAPIYRIGSTGADSSAQVVLQESDNGILSGWGWADQGWNGAGRHIYSRRAASTRCGFSSARAGSPSIRSYCRRTRS